MGFTVEASSLSVVTDIACNPPSHPTVPVPSPGLPLVLYIARVPGSRDVFLTPMKPRERVVTAEDVQSSLYYVHINCEDDRDAVEPERPSSANGTASRLGSIRETSMRRKPPLPARPAPGPVSLPYPILDHMPPFDVRPPSPPKFPQIARKPVLSDVTNTGPPVPPHHSLPEIPWRSLPAPPDQHSNRSSLHAENVRLPRRCEPGDDLNPYPQKCDPPLNDRNELADRPTGSEPGTLTLIRRDPGSSEQWNVASIHDPPVHEVSSSALLNPSAARRTKKGGAPLYLDITNEGYRQFIDHDRPGERRVSTSSRSSDADPVPEGTFRRRLYMPGSRHGDHGYGHHPFPSTDSASGGDMPKTLRDRTLSDLGGDGESGSTGDRRSQGYSFTSPWDGRCEFTTGATGRSLKCRHRVGPRGPVHEVSELRFNLPPSAHRPVPAPPPAEKRASYFSHARHRSHDSWDGGGGGAPRVVLDDAGRVDLSLGRERAGGGFGGKQAKLGKLIVEPEGLKMLDLLVAANVGLWWRAYERV